MNKQKHNQNIQIFSLHFCFEYTIYDRCMKRQREHTQCEEEMKQERKATWARFLGGDQKYQQQGENRIIEASKKSTGVIWAVKKFLHDRDKDKDKNKTNIWKKKSMEIVYTFERGIYQSFSDQYFLYNEYNIWTRIYFGKIECVK